MVRFGLLRGVVVLAVGEHPLQIRLMLLLELQILAAVGAVAHNKPLHQIQTILVPLAALAL